MWMEPFVKPHYNKEPMFIRLIDGHVNGVHIVTLDPMPEPPFEKLKDIDILPPFSKTFQPLELIELCAEKGVDLVAGARGLHVEPVWNILLFLPYIIEQHLYFLPQSKPKNK